MAQSSLLLLSALLYELPCIPFLFLYHRLQYLGSYLTGSSYKPVNDRLFLCTKEPTEHCLNDIISVFFVQGTNQLNRVGIQHQAITPFRINRFQLAAISHTVLFLRLNLANGLDTRPYTAHNGR